MTRQRCRRGRRLRWHDSHRTRGGAGCGRAPAGPALLAVLGGLALVLSGPALAGNVAGAPAERDAPAPPGRPLVIDGDTVQTGDGRVHDLAGIDAPELGQRCRQAGRWIECGQQAAFALNRVLGLSLAPLICTPVPQPQAATGAPETEPEPEKALEAERSPATRPSVSTCAIDGRKDIALAVLSQGLALALPEAPAAYREAAETARKAGLGLWRTDFVRPADWRRGSRLPDDPVLDPPPCPITGVIDATGGRVYLVPLDAGYAGITPDRVVTRFCSDEAARAAGWRRPGRPEDAAEEEAGDEADEAQDGTRLDAGTL